ncbi:hypothetical protein ACFOKI_11700 [Sphingomonas qilianensis]|uniref:Uncharacterized protein n=1 Tax=Sphingomonas qilianensis TaxID=1736690 RepID=A0ABU9XT94_9SPHN
MTTELGGVVGAMHQSLVERLVVPAPIAPQPMLFDGAAHQVSRFVGVLLLLGAYAGIVGLIW